MAVSTTLPAHRAHDRFKASFWPYVSVAMAISVAIHFAVLATARFEVGDDYVVDRAREMEEVLLQEQEFTIPPPPEQIARPAIPVMSTNVDISDQITIAEISFGEAAIEGPPPPPTAKPIDLSESPSFTPYEVRPKLSNLPEFQAALLEHYPPMLKRAGVGGVTVLWIFIDEAGSVRNTRVVETSGYAELDEAARIAVTLSARFSPALNRDVPVPVWIQMPITFESRG